MLEKYKHEIKWGVIFALSGLLWMAFERAVGLHDQYIAQHAVYTNLYAIVALVVYYLALRSKRETYHGGVMTWKQGFSTGIAISIVVAILSPVTQWITSEIITSDYFTNIIEYSVDEGLMTEEAATAYFSLTSYMIQAFFGALVMGVVTSALVALITKKSS